MISFRDKLTRLHPAWSLALVFLSVCTALIAVGTDTFVVHMASTLLIVLLSLLWAHGIYERANSSTDAANRSRWHHMLFIGTEVALAVAGLLILVVGPLNIQAATGGLPALIVIPYFVGLWLAASALANTEGQSQAAPGATFGTFLLIVYWVIGVWFIQPRIKRLNRETNSA